MSLFRHMSLFRQMGFRQTPPPAYVGDCASTHGTNININVVPDDVPRPPYPVELPPHYPTNYRRLVCKGCAIFGLASVPVVAVLIYLGIIAMTAVGFYCRLHHTIVSTSSSEIEIPSQRFCYPLENHSIVSSLLIGFGFFFGIFGIPPMLLSVFVLNLIPSVIGY